mgnify:FL=1
MTRLTWCLLLLFLIGCDIEEQEKEESLMEKTILIKDVISKVSAYSSNRLTIQTSSGKIYRCFDGDFGALVPGIGDTVYTIRLKDIKHRAIITKVVFGNSDGCTYKYTNKRYF